MCTYKWVDNGMLFYDKLCAQNSSLSAVLFVHSLFVFFRLINRFEILLPEFSDFAERMLTPVKEIAVVQLFGGIQKMEYMNRLLPIPFKVTRSCAALRAADLDWIVGPRKGSRGDPTDLHDTE